MTARKSIARRGKPKMELTTPNAPRVEEVERAHAVRERVNSKPAPFRVACPVEDGVMNLGAPHSDGKVWNTLALNAFGTGSPEFAMHLVKRVVNVARGYGEPHATTEAVNAALAFVDGFEPENEMQAMAAVSLYAANDLALSIIMRAKQAETLPAMTDLGNLAAKLIRASTAQMEALAKVRRGGEQTVRVEHVNVYAGGQAVVGNVTGGGGGQNATGQCREPGRQTEGIAPLLGVNATGDVVSVASDAERPVSVARRP